MSLDRQSERVVRLLTGRPLRWWRMVRRRWEIALGPQNDDFWYLIEHGRAPEEDQ